MPQARESTVHSQGQRCGEASILRTLSTTECGAQISTMSYACYWPLPCWATAVLAQQCSRVIPGRDVAWFPVDPG